MKAARWYLAYWFAQIEAYGHAVDVYFADLRGDALFSADAHCRKLEIERRITCMELNK